MQRAICSLVRSSCSPKILASVITQNVEAIKRLTLDWVPVSLKSKSWNWLGRFATAARSPILLCAYYPQESSKVNHGRTSTRRAVTCTKIASNVGFWRAEDGWRRAVVDHSGCDRMDSSSLARAISRSEERRV